MAYPSKAMSGANPKIFMKFVKYFYQDNRFKLFFFNGKNSDFDALFKLLSDFIETDLSQDSLQKVYEALPLDHSESDSQLISDYNAITGPDGLYEFGFGILKGCAFGGFTVEMYKLLTEKWLINSDYLPLVFYPDVTSEIQNQATAAEDPSQAVRLIKVLYSRSMSLNTVQRQSTKDNLVSTLASHADEIKALYGIGHLYLCGSYAKNLETEYSDVDLLVISNSADKDEGGKINSYFSTILGISADLRVVKDASEANLDKTVQIF